MALLESSPSSAAWFVFGEDVVPAAAARVNAVGMAARALRRPGPVATAHSEDRDDGTAGDGQLSPSFDASFASSMSISPGRRSDAMDISPNLRALGSDARSPAPAAETATNLPSFFESLKTHQPPLLKSRYGSATSVDGTRSFGATVTNGASSESAATMLAASRAERKPRPRGQIPATWQTARPNIGPDAALIPRNTEPARPTVPWLHAVAPRSVSNPMPTRTGTIPTSSPNAMDVDGRSPAPAAQDVGNASFDSPSGATEALADMFDASLSPLAPSISRKRSFTPADDDDDAVSLTDVEDGDDVDVGASPLAGVSRRMHGSLNFQPLGARVFEKAHTTTSGLNGSLNARRRQAHARRPSLQATFSHAPYELAPASKRARDLDGSKLVRPQLLANRRTQSVCAIPPVLGPATAGSSIGLGRPSAALNGRGSLARPTLTDSRRVVSMGPGAALPDGAILGSPEPALPAHASEEADGKALPCHKVTADGLMRIRPSVLNDLIEGKYSALIDSYTICDARFTYEHIGGHVHGAINLQTEAAVERHFLGVDPAALPLPARSGEPHGRKAVLVFHCEFSAMRAPTLAKFLRSRDRALNAADYPRVHYPELYILEGGYAAFFAEFPHHCTPESYIRMDDPAYVHARHLELNSFRRRQTFQRARSDSALGTMKGGAAPFLTGMAAAPSARPIVEEDHEPVVAPVVTSSPSGSDVGDSPCPGGARRSATIPPLARRDFGRTVSLWR